MKIMIIGKGSMSTRRQNFLKTARHEFITYDITDNITCREVMDKYKPDGMIISCPPTTKQQYITLANKHGLKPFCEADIVDYQGDYFPSCSLRFHDGINKIKELLKNETIGKIYTFQYRLGQHIRDWRPKGFDFTNYYAAKHGGPEMVIFELGWLSYLFGTPQKSCGMTDRKMNDTQISSNDVFAMAVQFPVCIGSILVDVFSRPATRSLTVIGSNGTLLWNWDNSYITIDFADGTRTTEGYDKGTAAEGYHAAICEDMYENEIRNFIEAIQGKAEYLYSREEEKACINMLRKVEV